jgi:1-acyl-sn-glycerol-3-phosphate acyltransferase
MLKARHHAVIYPFFRWYAGWKIRRHFGVISLTGEYHNTSRPLLVIANHATWWDGFWVLYLNNKVFRKKFHFMMLEEQLKRYRLFNHTGGFSVRKGSRSVIESLEYTAGLLRDPGNMVLLFPQGEITTMHTRRFHFMRGVEWILDRVPDVQVLFVANMVDWFSAPRPGLYVWYEEYGVEGGGLAEIERAYSSFYERSVEMQHRRAF